MDDAENLDSLALEGGKLDAAPVVAAAAEVQAQQSDLAQSNETELFATLTLAREVVFPLLSMALHPARFAVLESVWQDSTLRKSAEAGAEVMALHGWTMSDAAGKWGPYVKLGAALLPPAVVTYKVLTMPVEGEPEPGQDGPPGQKPAAPVEALPA